jgi:PAS domain-containing protein
MRIPPVELEQDGLRQLARDQQLKDSPPSRTNAPRIDCRAHRAPVGPDRSWGSIRLAERLEHRAIEDQLREAEGRFRTLVEHATDGIFIAGADGRYQDVNPAGCAMLGYSRDELLSPLDE